MSPALTEFLEAKNEACTRWLPRHLHATSLLPPKRSASRLKRNEALSLVHGVGIGYKQIGGKRSKDLAVQLFVTQKVSERLLSKKYRLPRDLGGLPIDVIESSVFIASALPPQCPNPRVRHTQLCPGLSVSNFEVFSGTLACFCRSLDVNDNGLYVLSASHVFTSPGAQHRGARLYQPARNDNALPADVFARLERFVRPVLSLDFPNRVDCAVGKVDSRARQGFGNQLCDIGPVQELEEAQQDSQVMKFGRSTGLTYGVISTLSYDGVVSFPYMGSALFINQIIVERAEQSQWFALAGDSGSLLVNAQTHRGVGLIIAAAQDGSRAIANHLSDVFRELAITF